METNVHLWYLAKFSVSTKVRRTRQIVTLQAYLVSLGAILILRFYVICLVLGAFTELRKATASIVMSVCLSARNNAATSGLIFMKFDVWVLFENVMRKFRFRQNTTRITGTWDDGASIFVIISRWILLRMRNKMKTLRLYSKTFYWKSRRSWNKVEKML